MNVRLRLFALTLASAAWTSSCGSGNPSRDDGRTDDRCSDVDGDGYGVGPGCGGPDCNDFVPSVHADAECAAWCDSHDVSPGCPCTAAADDARPCYVGVPETEGVGACTGGATLCIDGTWGACAGQVLPQEETCDIVDNDCDGEVDDREGFDCGVCTCEVDCTGPECAEWGAPLPDGLTETPEGWLTLDRTVPIGHVLWPTSGGTSEALRVNTQTFEVEAAFWTGPNHAGVVPSIDAYAGDNPSRSAVDAWGNLLIANRAHEYHASVTRIAADPATCPDADADGTVETSTGWDDKLPFDDHDHWEDECILWHTRVGEERGAIARAIAVHRVDALDGAAAERAWVGLFYERRFVELDVETGEPTGRVAPTGTCNPYGAAVDRQGVVWVTCISQQIGRFDTATPADSYSEVRLPGGIAYRVIVDEHDAPWVAGPEDVSRWNRAEGAFESVGVRQGVGHIASDGHGSIWAGSYSDEEHVYRISNDAKLSFHRVQTPGVDTFGMAVDFDGHAWAFGGTRGNAAVIDLSTEAVQVVLDDCGDGGLLPCLSFPYVRGDITGRQRVSPFVAARGVWRKVVEGCSDEGTDWRRIVLEASVPDGTHVAVAARTAATLGDLSAESWIAVAGSDSDEPGVYDLETAFPKAGVEDEHLLEVEVALASEDATDAPVVRSVEVLWTCATGVD